MNVTCGECGSVFRVDPAKVPAGGVRARCSVCGGVIAVATQAVPAAVTVATGVRATPPPPHAPPADLSQGSRRVPPPVATPVSPPARPAAPAAPPAPRAPVELPVEPGVRPGPRIAPRADTRLPTPPISVAGVGTRPAAEAPTPAGEPPRRINPYLSNDPSQKARRLARALVSDLVVYYPQKREEGLRAGTLKELFRDEIRKSWEEYVAQVGAPLAESTPHFQDALNDVLAGGRKVF